MPRRMRSTLSGHCTPPRLTQPLTSPSGRRRVPPPAQEKGVRAPLLLLRAHRTPSLLPREFQRPSPRSSPEAELLFRLFHAPGGEKRGLGGGGENTGVVYRRARPRSVREGGARRPALAARPSLPPQPSPRADAPAPLSRFFLFSPPFPPSFPFLFFFPLPPLPPFPLGGASPGQGQSRPHPAPLPGPRRPMERGRLLLTRAPAAAAAAVGGAGPAAAAAAASGPGSSWN